MTALDIESMIYAAFAGVTREGGISWQEGWAVDYSRGTPEKLAAARARDKDHFWTELVTDASWDPDTLSDFWTFIDAIGFRFYLPPAMIRSLRGEQLGLDTLLLIGAYDDYAEHLRPHHIGRTMRELLTERYDFFNDDQFRATAEYVRWMTLQEEAQLEAGQWHRGWNNAWRDVWLLANNGQTSNQIMPLELKPFEILCWEESERRRRER